MLSGLVVAHITCVGSSIVSQGSWSVSQWGMTRLYLVGTIPTKGWSAPLRAHSALINSSDEYRVRPEVFVRSSNIRAGNWKCSPPSSVDFVPVVCKVNATLNIKRKVQRFSSTARAAIAIQRRGRTANARDSDTRQNGLRFTFERSSRLLIGLYGWHDTRTKPIESNKGGVCAFKFIQN